MNVMQALLAGVSEGKRWNVDFKSKSIKLNGKYLLKEGVGNYETSVSTENVLGNIERLYAEYKYSLPSERSDRKRRKYFKALSQEELTTEMMCIGEIREMAQARLESFILCAYLSGFDWSDIKGWFWQGTDRDLIIIKNWF